jgi:hypothetical protein
MTSLDEIRELLCSDDPADQARARTLAGADSALAAALDEAAQLDAAVAAWKASPPAPVALRAKIMAQAEAITAQASPGAASLSTAAAVPEREDTPVGPVVWWQTSRTWQVGLALAASLVVAVLAVRTVVPEPFVVSTSGRLLVTDALAAAHEAEQQHAAAIANLQRTVEPILRRADDPRLDARQAALLLAYRDRIAAIDTAIAEVNSYLQENPGLASARTVLLAAYIDKSRILEEVLERENQGELG